MIVQFIIHHSPTQVAYDWLRNCYIISGPGDNRPLLPSVTVRYRAQVSHYRYKRGDPVTIVSGRNAGRW